MNSSPSQSPAWKNPREQLKNWQRRRKLDLSGPCPSLLHPSASQPALSSFSKRPSSRKVQKSNPFRKSPRKKLLKLSYADENTQFPDRNPLLGALENEDSLQSPDACNSPDCEANSGLQTDFSSLVLQQNQNQSTSTPRAAKFEPKNEGKVEISAEKMPVDLRLATAVRIQSKTAFPWSGKEGFNLKTAEKTNGIQMFVKGEPSTQPEATVSSRLFATTLYWVYPSIPWVQAFPRIERQQRLSAAREQKTPSIATLGSAIEDQLYLDWQSSFENLFQSLRCESCSYFYVCCPTFTVLFVNAGQGLNAVISPSSSGFRKLLRDEKIEFSCPLRPGSRRTSRDSSDSQSNCAFPDDMTQSQPPFLAQTDTQSCLEPPTVDLDNSAEDGFNTSGEKDNLDFLLSIGVSPSIQNKLKRSKSSSDRYSTGSGRGSEEPSKTVLLVTGDLDVQALYNVIHCNKQVCQAMTGPQAGLPPTLLASEPFLGAAMKSLQLNSRSNSNGHTLDLTGPILPSTVFSLNKLLTESMDKMDKFTISTTSKQSYPGFNAALTNAGTSQDFELCNSSIDFAQALGNSQFCDAADFSFENGVYKWS